MKQKLHKTLEKSLVKIKDDLNKKQKIKILQEVMSYSGKVEIPCDENKDIAYLRYEHTSYKCAYCCKDFKIFSHLHSHVKGDKDDEPGKLVIDDEMPVTRKGGPNRGLGLMVSPKGIPACFEAEYKCKCENCSRKFRHWFSAEGHKKTCPRGKGKIVRLHYPADEQQPAPSKQFKPDPLPKKEEVVFKSEFVGPHLLEQPTMNDITFVDPVDIKFDIIGGWKKESDFMDQSMDTSTWTYPESRYSQ